MNEIKGEMIYIPIEELYPHPDNPRKDVGDVSELAESIKSKGIMQNLTVVKGHHYVKDGESYYDASEGYTVIIGHRRRAASELAGLKELPCVVVKMEYKDQIATMLLENMQRSDLTVLEEAAGIQMMLELGETVEGIAQKTGFSQNTVRRRTRLSELDQDKLRDAMKRQVNLTDLDKLNKIDDISARNKLLDDIGTYNFENKLRKILDAQEREKNTALWRKKLLAEGMTEITYNDCWNGNYGVYERNFINVIESPDEFSREENEDYFAFNYGAVYVRGKKRPSDNKVNMEERKKRERYERRKEQLEEASERAYELRRAFVFKISEISAMRNISIIAEMVMRNRYEACAQGGWYMRWRGENFTDGEIPGNYEAVAATVERHPYQTMLRNAYALWADGSCTNTFDYTLKYVENERLSLIYEFLCKLGYEMSDEEKQIMDGSHKLYVTGEEE